MLEDTLQNSVSHTQGRGHPLISSSRSSPSCVSWSHPPRHLVWLLHPQRQTPLHPCQGPLSIPQPSILVKAPGSSTTPARRWASLLLILQSHFIHSSPPNPRETRTHHVPTRLRVQGQNHSHGFMQSPTQETDMWALLCTELPERKCLKFQGRHCKRPRKQIRSTVPLPALRTLPQTLMHVRIFALVPILQAPQRQGVIHATGPADLHPPSACNRGSWEVRLLRLH